MKNKNVCIIKLENLSKEKNVFENIDMKKINK